MNRKRYDSVWDAIEETVEEAQNMKLRSSLMMALQEHISRAKLNQAQAAKLFGVTQPRISNLMHGKIDLFAIDTLVNMASAAGIRVEMRLRKAA
jgi:predicted XRE-type DNA-binding protein